MANEGTKQLGEIRFVLDASDLRGALSSAGGSTRPGGAPSGPQQGELSRALSMLARTAQAVRSPSGALRGALSSLGGQARPVAAPPIVPVAAAGAAEGAAALGAAEGAGAAAGGAAAAGGGALAALGGPVGIAIAAVAGLALVAGKASGALGRLVDGLRSLDEQTSEAVRTYGALNGGVAAAAAMGDVARLMADLRSASVRAPSLRFAAAGGAYRDAAFARLGDQLRPIQYALVGVTNMLLGKAADLLARILEGVGGLVAFLTELAGAIGQVIAAFPGMAQIGQTLSIAIPVIVSRMNAIASAVAPTSFAGANQWALDDIAAMTQAVPYPRRPVKGLVI